MTFKKQLMKAIGFVLCFFVTSTSILAQVNLQTGAAEQSFPLFNYVDSKSGLSTGIAVNYSSGNGLLISDLASDVGTGWNLEAGGIIMRMQVGQPDDQPEFNNGQQSGPQSLLRYPAGFLYNSNIGKGCNIGHTYIPIFTKDDNNSGASVYKDKNIVAGDTEQDRFVFHFNGRSGSFIIGRDGNITVIGDSRIKCSFTTQDMTAQGIRTTINQFVIITEDGIKYTFRDKSLSQLFRYKYSEYKNNAWVPVGGTGSNDGYAVNNYIGYPLAMNERPYVVNSWFLSEMENTNNGSKIQFQYDNIYTDIVSGKYISHSRNIGGADNNARNLYSLLCNEKYAKQYANNLGLLGTIPAGSTSITYNRAANYTFRLKKIILPSNGYIELTYTDKARVDLAGENALSEVSYYINNSLIRKYKFTYGYFVKNEIKPYDYTFSTFEAKFARLCLLSVQKVGTQDDKAYEPPYLFSYYTGNKADDIVPPRNSLSQDHWGFYNGQYSSLSANEDHDFLADKRQYSNITFPYYRTIKKDFAKNGLLKKMTYPTGGSITYNYSQNVSPKILYEGNNGQYAGGVSVSTTVMSNEEEQSKDIINDYRYVTTTGISSRWGLEEPSNYQLSSFDINFKNPLIGKKYEYPGVSYSEMATSIDNPLFNGKSLIKIAVSVGLQYALTTLFTATVSNIIGGAMMLYTIVKTVMQVSGKTPEVHTFLLTNSNNINANPLSVFNSRVEVRTNSPLGGYNGVTVYEFTNDKDYQVFIPTLEWPYIQAPRVASWIYGMPKSVKQYDRQGQLVKESLNNFNFYVQKLANQNNENCRCATRDLKGSKSVNWENGDQYFSRGTDEFLVSRFYYLYTGRTDLVSTVENSYSNGKLFNSNSVTITTDPGTLLQRAKTVGERAEPLNGIASVYTMRTQISYYPTDFTIGGAVDLLKQNNAIHTPLVTETWQITYTIPALFYPGSINVPYISAMNLVDANVTEFKTYTVNGKLQAKPWKLYKLKTKQPVPMATIGMHNPNMLIRKPEYYHVVAEFIYDNNGELVQTNQEDEMVSYVNDYDSKYVTATVKNAVNSDIAYTSFETMQMGGWHFPMSSRDINNGFAGTNGYIMDNSITSNALDAAKTYVVTFWLKKGTGYAKINDQDADLLFESARGWQFYRKEISGINLISITGNRSTIDELRLYPKGSLMSTVVYKDGIGKIAELDANNRVVFYEYDSLGRLRLIKDEDGNIIKTYEYNYKSANQ